MNRCPARKPRPRNCPRSGRRICRRTNRSDRPFAPSLRAASLAAPLYALALALAVTAPLLAPGYLLLRDAVSTPRSYLSDSSLGLSQAAPRALPQDYAVALASAVLDGGVVVKALLILGLWLAGWGAARLAATVLPDAGVAGQCVAVTIAIWNPYVAERLLQGHWSLLVGYGCLPWVAATVLALRGIRRRSALKREPRRIHSGGMVCGLVFWIALAGLTPTGLMLAAVIALASRWRPVTAGPGGSARRSAWARRWLPRCPGSSLLRWRPGGRNRRLPPTSPG